MKKALAFYLAMGLVCVAASYADTKTWTGAVDDKWSTAGNWSGGVPIAGDRIVFGTGAANKVNINDLTAGTVFYDITFLTNVFTLLGNKVGLTNGISGTTGNAVNLDIDLGASQTFANEVYGGTINFGSYVLTIGGGATVSGTLTGTGTLNFPSGLITGTVSGSAVLNFGTSSSGNTVTISGTIVSASQVTFDSYYSTTTLSGNNTYAGPTKIKGYQHYAEIDGQQPSSAVTVEGSAFLCGTGRLGDVTFNSSYYITPGKSNGGLLGILSTGSLAFNSGSYQVQLNGSVPGTGYDQLQVNGTVTLNNPYLSAYQNFNGAKGQIFVIIMNDGNDPVSGTFNGYPEGSTVNVGAYPYTLSYIGGSGNDVTLTSQSYTGQTNQAPIAGLDSYTATADTQKSVAAPGVLQNDSDPDSDPISIVSYTSTSEKGGTVVLNADGSFTYDPPVGFVGVDIFSYLISDGKNATGPGFVKITVGLPPKLSGKVTLGGGLASVVLNGLPGNPTTNAAGEYSANVHYDWSGTVTPALEGYVFTPLSRAYANVIADQADQDYFATALPTYVISGTVTLGGAPLAGVVMSGLRGNPVTDASGFYAGIVYEGWSGTVTPTLAWKEFLPANRTYAGVAADQPDQWYQATPLTAKKNDLDGDGKPDILWRNYATGENRIWLLDGAAIKGTAAVEQVPDTNWVIVGTGDFNGDGPLDIVWRHTLWGEVGIWLMNGPAHVGDVGLGPVDLVWHIDGIADFNGDAKPDFLWRNTKTGDVNIWLMDGTAHVGDALLGTVDPSWQIVGTGDFNGDGECDILWRNAYWGEFNIWLMAGTAHMGDATLGLDDLGWTIVGTADFNGDGKCDILRRNYATGENVVWYMDGTTHAGTGALPPEMDPNWMIIHDQGSPVPPPPPPPTPTIKNDFNGDGKSDILWRHYKTGQNRVWHLDGTTVLSTGGVDPVGDLNWVITGTGDFNGDGKPDIIWRHLLWGEVGIWFMNGTAHVGDASLGAVDLTWHVVETGDFNGDGKTDILWRNSTWGEFNIWLMDGTVHAGDATFGNIDLAWEVVGTGDFNGDAKTDIVWRNKICGEVGIWIMDGTAHAADYSLGNDSLNWMVVGTGDYNGDGKCDILRRNYATGENSIWFMDGLTLSSTAALPPETDPYWMITYRKRGALPPGVYAKADFNGDGSTDLLWRNTAWGEAGIWFMNGIAHVGDASLGNIDLNWDLAGTGDFNKDGKADLLWRNKVSGEAGIRLMDGTAVWAEASLGPVDLTWQIAGVGDFNGDGKDDILWRNTSSGGVNIWLMDGTTHDGDVLLGAVDLSWQVAGTGDFNGDGKIDILWRNAFWGEIGIWFMDGTSHAGGASLGNVDLIWEIAGTGDFNLDGKVDILWRNLAWGEVGVWYMDGTAHVGDASIAVVDLIWRLVRI